MLVRLEKKVTDLNIDRYVNEIFTNFQQNRHDSYIFDFSNVEIIGNQELLVFTGIFQIFYESDITFRINFFKNGVSPLNAPERNKRQIIQIWEVWKIAGVVEQRDYVKIFGMGVNVISQLKKQLNYYPKAGEIYSRNEVTPFVCLRYYNNYDSRDIERAVSNVYRLNQVTSQILAEAGCSHPFTSNSLSNIVTEELYTNFLDHSTKSAFNGLTNLAFMSISFQPMLSEANYDEQRIQRNKKWYFETEALHEMRDFFYDPQKQSFKNIPYIQFSFVDFGVGIPVTMQEQFSKSGAKESGFDILQYAFQHDTSRHPLQDKQIPRGLFDVLTIVKRYRGLMVIRSNRSRIAFDFSYAKNVKSAYRQIEHAKGFFPGTLISIYLPAIKDISKLDVSAIRPEFEFSKVGFGQKRYITLTRLVELIHNRKEELYENILNELKKLIARETGPTLFFLNCANYDNIPNRVLKKVLYFLISDYSINNKTNFIVINLDDKALFEEMSNELLLLNQAIKNYKIHPLAIVNFDSRENKVEVSWLGVYSEVDRKKLDELLFEDIILNKSEFAEPGNAIGSVNSFDLQGNLRTNFPAQNQLVDIFRNEEVIGVRFEVERLLKKYQAIRYNNNESWYLCNGNYYQSEYVELSNILNDQSDCRLLSHFLYLKLSAKAAAIDDLYFIGITTAGAKIVKMLQLLGYVAADKCLIIDNRQHIDRDISAKNIREGRRYILICDVFSTGKLCQQVDHRIKLLKGVLSYVGVFVNTGSREFAITEEFLSAFNGEVVSLYEYEIKKRYLNDLTDDIASKKIIRVNPHTTVPVTVSIEETRYFDTVLYKTEHQYDEPKQVIAMQHGFLRQIPDASISIGYRMFNNVIHPYFFETINILNLIDAAELKEIFDRINLPALSTESIQVFYPRGSGIEGLRLATLKEALGNHAIEAIEMERFGTSEGWKFPHNTAYLNNKINDNICLILDDGSCSGDSMMQMIDEISFYPAREIILLCFIGRVNDHKREFFSRLSQIKVKEGNSVKISVYFVSHWHIPTYYSEDNPNTKELTWLKDVLHVQNTPLKIREIAGRIREIIEPKTNEEFKEHEYLPRMRMPDGKKGPVPKKDILLVREEIGKIIGYRLYSESFAFFDNFIKKYSRPVKSIDRFREIELLCATFVYEPYLYEKIIPIIPDVAERIATFVKLIIVNKGRLQRLTYRWNKKDILHLFFIVFRNERLVSELTVKMFRRLIDFSNNKVDTFNYILYKLLYYFPLNASQIPEKKYANNVKNLIGELIQSEVEFSKELKKFFNYVTTLPIGEDFHSMLAEVRLNYEKDLSPETHIEKASFNHTISFIVANIRTCIRILENNETLTASRITEIQQTWLTITEFIKPILRFTLSYTGFLTPYPFNDLLLKVETSDESSLRKLVGLNDDLLFELDEHSADIESLKAISNNLLNVQIIVQADSVFADLMRFPFTDFQLMVENLIKAIHNAHSGLVVTGLELLRERNFTDVPQLYSQMLIIKELPINITNHGDPDSPVYLDLSRTQGHQYQIRIQNKMNKAIYKNSNAEGLKCLNFLADFEYFGFQFLAKEEHEHFIQFLTFTVHEH